MYLLVTIKKPRSGDRMQPTAQAVAREWKTKKPQRGERSLATQLNADCRSLSLTHDGRLNLFHVHPVRGIHARVASGAIAGALAIAAGFLQS